jgi:hypothetical protein
MTLLLIGLIIAQYFVSKTSLNTFVSVLDRFLPRSFIFALISLLFFPGTLVHEGSHVFTALCLFLPVKNIHLWPEWDHKSIKLGHVEYEKRGLWRSIIVGLAPLPFGLFAIWFIVNWHLPVWLTGYLMFVITSTMFSSKSDLVDVIYIIPLAIVGFLIWFFFPGVVEGILGFITSQKGFTALFDSVVMTTMYYVGYSIAIHMVVIVVGWILGSFIRR